MIKHEVVVTDRRRRCSVVAWSSVVAIDRFMDRGSHEASDGYNPAHCTSIVQLVLLLLALLVPLEGFDVEHDPLLGNVFFQFFCHL